MMQRAGPTFWRDFTGELDAAIGSETVLGTSWWRSVAHNREVGGVASSQHLVGAAVDLVAAPSVLAAIADRLSGRLVVVRESDHLHVQAFSAEVARQVVALVTRAGSAA